MKTARRREGREWIGGSMRLDSYVTGEGTPRFGPRPSTGSATTDTSSALRCSGPARSPRSSAPSSSTRCAPPLPARVRVASSEHAEALRSALADSTEIVCAPTPELDPFFASLAASLESGENDDPPTYLTAGMTPDLVGEKVKQTFSRSEDRA